jgi:hypothetical protein
MKGMVGRSTHNYVYSISFVRGTTWRCGMAFKFACFLTAYRTIEALPQADLSQIFRAV